MIVRGPVSAAGEMSSWAWGTSGGGWRSAVFAVAIFGGWVGMVVGFALSGGGAKGDFELGALRLLYDRGVRPDIMASTSVGSINASKLAEGEPDAAHPDRGLPGLEKLWESLQRNEDMYREEAWL